MITCFDDDHVLSCRAVAVPMLGREATMSVCGGKANSDLTAIRAWGDFPRCMRGNSKGDASYARAPPGGGACQQFHAPCPCRSQQDGCEPFWQFDRDFVR